MMKALKKVNWKKLGIFAGGVLFGTAGIKVLSSKDAKNVYTHCTAGVLRAKDCVMKTANTIQENCGDIYAGAKDINEARAQKAAEYNPGFVPNNKYVEILEISKAISDIKDIMDAKILVSGGRGVGSAENFKLLDDLAEVLGGWST